MKEFWETLVNWLQNNGVSEIISLGTLGTTIGAIIGCVKSLRKTTIKEIKASAENIKTSKEFADTCEQIKTFKDEINKQNERLGQLSAMLLVILNNSKVSASAKTQALEILNAKSEFKNNEIKKVETINDVVKKVEESIVENIETNNVETNPYLTNLDGLINDEKEDM